MSGSSIVGHTRKNETKKSQQKPETNGDLRKL